MQLVIFIHILYKNPQKQKIKDLYKQNRFFIFFGREIFATTAVSKCILKLKSLKKIQKTYIHAKVSSSCMWRDGECTGDVVRDSYNGSSRV